MKLRNIALSLIAVNFLEWINVVRGMNILSTISGQTHQTQSWNSSYRSSGTKPQYTTSYPTVSRNVPSSQSSLILSTSTGLQSSPVLSSSTYDTSALPLQFPSFSSISVNRQSPSPAVSGLLNSSNHSSVPTTALPSVSISTFSLSNEVKLSSVQILSINETLSLSSNTQASQSSSHSIFSPIVTVYSSKQSASSLPQSTDTLTVHLAHSFLSFNASLPSTTSSFPVKTLSLNSSMIFSTTMLPKTHTSMEASFTIPTISHSKYTLISSKIYSTSGPLVTSSRSLVSFPTIALPNSTTALPNSITALPNSTTALPNSTTALLNSITALPNSTTALLNSITALPNSTTALLNSTTALPNSTTALLNSRSLTSSVSFSQTPYSSSRRTSSLKTTSMGNSSIIISVSSDILSRTGLLSKTAQMVSPSSVETFANKMAIMELDGKLVVSLKYSVKDKYRNLQEVATALEDILQRALQQVAGYADAKVLEILITKDKKSKFQCMFQVFIRKPSNETADSLREKIHKYNESAGFGDFFLHSVETSAYSSSCTEEKIYLWVIIVIAVLGVLCLLLLAALILIKRKLKNLRRRNDSSTHKERNGNERYKDFFPVFDGVDETQHSPLQLTSVSSAESKTKPLKSSEAPGTDSEPDDENSDAENEVAPVSSFEAEGKDKQEVEDQCIPTNGVLQIRDYEVEDEESKFSTFSRKR